MIINYIVKAKYGRSKKTDSDNTINKIMAEEAYVPKELICTAEIVDPINNSTKKLFDRTIENKIDQNPESYDLTGIAKPTLYLTQASVEDLTKLGVKKDLAEKLTKVMKDYNISSKAALKKLSIDERKDHFTDLQKKQIDELFEWKHVRLYSIKD